MFRKFYKLTKKKLKITLLFALNSIYCGTVLQGADLDKALQKMILLEKEISKKKHFQNKNHKSLPTKKASTKPLFSQNESLEISINEEKEKKSPINNSTSTISSFKKKKKIITPSVAKKNVANKKNLPKPEISVQKLVIVPENTQQHSSDSTSKTAAVNTEVTTTPIISIVPSTSSGLPITIITKKLNKNKNEIYDGADLDHVIDSFEEKTTPQTEDSYTSLIDPLDTSVLLQLKKDMYVDTKIKTEKIILNKDSKSIIKEDLRTVKELKNKESNTKNKIIDLSTKSIEQQREKEATPKQIQNTSEKIVVLETKPKIPEIRTLENKTEKKNDLNPSITTCTLLEKKANEGLEKEIDKKTNEQKKEGHIQNCVQKLEDKKKGSESDPETKSEKYEKLPSCMITTESSPTMKWSGDLCYFFAAMLQEDIRSNKEGDPHIGLGWADLVAETSGSFLPDWDYKYTVILNAVPGDIGISENFAEISTPYGILKFGNTKGPEKTMFCNGMHMLGGVGGVYGSFWDMCNVPAGMPNIKYQTGYTKDATKLVFYTARIMGFQLGVGFCPRPHHIGWNEMGDDSYTPGDGADNFESTSIKKRMNIAVGINFDQNINEDINIQLSFITIREKSALSINLPKEIVGENYYDLNVVYDNTKDFALESTPSYQASAAIKIKDLGLACGMINGGKMNLPLNTQPSNILGKYGAALGDCGKSWNVGGKYSVGCLDFGLAYLKAKRKVTGYDYAQGSMTAFSVDFQVFPGIQFFAEVNHFKAQSGKSAVALENNEKPIKNTGTAVFIGSKVSF